MPEPKKLHWDEAAEQRQVNELRWFCRGCNREMHDERMARYCCSTHQNCERCGSEIRSKSYTKCDACISLDRWEQWEKKPEVDWDGEFPISIAWTDHYFWCIDEFVEWLEEQHDEDIDNGMPEDMANWFSVKHLMIEDCSPSKPRAFEVDDFLCDDLGEDGELNAAPSTIIELNDHVNKWIAEHAPKLWYGNGVRLSTKSIQAAVDAYVKECG